MNMTYGQSFIITQACSPRITVLVLLKAGVVPSGSVFYRAERRQRSKVEMWGGGGDGGGMVGKRLARGR